MTSSADAPSLPCERFADLPANTPGTNPQIDESAMALLKKSAETMFALTSYRAECWATSFPRISRQPNALPSYALSRITAEKPNRLHFNQWLAPPDLPGGWPQQTELPRFTFVCDGATLWQQFGKMYRESGHSSPDYLHTLSEPWQGFFSLGASPYCMTEHQRTYAAAGEVREARRDGRDVVEGIFCEKVFLHSLALYKGTTQDHRTTWYIGDDGLVRREVQRVEIDGTGGFIRDSVVRHLETNVPIADPDTLYKYVPPEGVLLEERGVQRK